MFRPASRALLRAPGVAVRGPAGKRLISTTPAEPKSRSWKNTAARFGLAIGAVYYYNTSSYFAKEPEFSFRKQLQTDVDDSSLPTLDSIKPKIREQKAPAPEKQQQQEQPAVAADGQQQQQPQHGVEDAMKSPQELEEEASQEAAFNPETGEINWDCPCLGGMAHGPCGEDFKAAFSCFVYSNEEPKGIECIDKFKAMQDCFRQHPEIYGAELEDDEAPAPEGQQPTEQQPETPSTPQTSEPADIPEKWHDAESKNDAPKPSS